MQALLSSSGTPLDAIYYCPHHPKGTIMQYRQRCACRKPEPGMGIRAAEEFNIDLGRSFVIGDKQSDLLFGGNLGASACLVRTGFGAYEETTMDANMQSRFGVSDNVLDAVKWVVHKDGQGYG
jgi:D-glycero-D-manno-heptose 1,7-bisphosphate phosphatase